MKKLILVIFLLFPLFLIFFRDKALADDRCYEWSFKDEKGEDIDTAPKFYKSIDKINYTFKIKGADKTKYNIRLCPSLGSCSDFLDSSNNDIVAVENTITGTITNAKSLNAPKDPIYNHFEVIKNGGVEPLICQYPIVWMDPPPSQSADCKLTLEPSNNITPDKNLTLTGDITNVEGLNDYSIYKSFYNTYGYNPIIELRGEVNKVFRDISLTNSGKSFSVNLLSDYPDGSYTATAKLYISGLLTGYIPVKCYITFTVPEGIPIPAPIPKQCIGKDAREAQSTNPPDCSSTYIDCNWCKVVKSKQQKKPNIQIPDIKLLCEQLSGEFSGKCRDCMYQDKTDKTGTPSGAFLWTAIGCIPTKLDNFVSDVIFNKGIGIAGGVAFLYFIYGAFMILTSSGNPERIEEAKQIITSSLAGLFLIIFSVFLLQVVGIDILQLPGFK